MNKKNYQCRNPRKGKNKYNYPDLETSERNMCLFIYEIVIYCRKK